MILFRALKAPAILGFCRDRQSGQGAPSGGQLPEGLPLGAFSVSSYGPKPGQRCAPGVSASSRQLQVLPHSTAQPTPPPQDPCLLPSLNPRGSVPTIPALKSWEGHKSLGPLPILPKGAKYWRHRPTSQDASPSAVGVAHESPPSESDTELRSGTF